MHKLILRCCLVAVSMILVSARAGGSTNDLIAKGVEFDVNGNIVRTANGRVLPRYLTDARRFSHAVHTHPIADRLSNNGIAQSPLPAEKLLATTPLSEGGSPQFNEIWRRMSYGSGIGLSGLVTGDIDSDGTLEIIAGGSSNGFGRNDYWNVIEFDPNSKKYEIVWSSRDYSDLIGFEGITAITGTATSSGSYQIIIGLASGNVEVIDGKSLTSRSLTRVSFEEIRKLTFADANNDGGDDLVVLTDSSIYIYDFPSLLLKQTIGFGGLDFAVGNVDNDPNNEIVLASGRVFMHDGVTLVEKWDRSTAPFGFSVHLTDINDDQVKEIIGTQDYETMYAFDAVAHTEIWRATISSDIDAVAIGDIDQDGVEEIVYGDGQWGAIHALDARTGVELWYIPNPEHGTTNIAVADTDGDGRMEVLWGAGASSSGADRLYVVDAVSQVEEFVSVHIDGPFRAMDMGDVDGDGVQELIFASFTSDSGYGDGILSIYDASTFALKWESPIDFFLSNAWTGIHDLAIGDVDNDGFAEVVVATDHLYDGALYVVDPRGGTIKNTYIYDDGSPLYAVDIADIDNDGLNEIIAGSAIEHSGSPGVFVYVIDGANGAVKWSSTNLPSGINALEAADLNNDGFSDIVAASSPQYLYLIDGATRSQVLLQEGGYYGVDMADIDGNGMKEILIGKESGDVVSIDHETLVETTLGTVCPSAVTSVRSMRAPSLNGTIQFSCKDSIGLFDLSSKTVVWRSESLGYKTGEHNSLVVADVVGVPTLAVGTLRGVRVFGTSANALPVVQDSYFNVRSKLFYTGTLLASDLNGDLLSFEIVTPPTKGVLVLEDPVSGRFTYTPSRRQSCRDSFTFRVTDGHGYSEIGTVRVKILGARVKNDRAIHWPANTAAMVQ